MPTCGPWRIAMVCVTFDEVSGKCINFLEIAVERQTVSVPLKNVNPHTWKKPSRCAILHMKLSKK